MEVSNDESEPCGQELVEALVTFSGLPELLIRPELVTILDESGQNNSDLTLEQLREAMMSYLEKIHEAMEQESAIE